MAGAGLLVAQLALPGMAAVALFAAGSPPWWQARLALVAAGLPLVAVLAARRHRVELIGYAVTGAVVAVTVPGLAPLVVAGDEPLALYAALAALGVALVALRDRPAAEEREPARSGVLLAAGGTLTAVAVLAALPTVLIALVSPYGSRERVWSGCPGRRRPDGVPRRGGTRRAGGGRRAGRSSAPPVGAARAAVRRSRAAGAAHRGRRALAGAAGRCPARRAGRAAARRAGPGPHGARTDRRTGGRGAGGLRRGGSAGHPRRDARCRGALLVAAVVVAVGGRRVEVRVVGCLAAVGAAAALAVTAPLAGGLPLRVAAYPLLGWPHWCWPPRPCRRPAWGGCWMLPRRPSRWWRRRSPSRRRGTSPPSACSGCRRRAATVAPGEPAGRRWAFAGIAAGSELLGAWVLLAAGGSACWRRTQCRQPRSPSARVCWRCVPGPG
ncbi:hypothetical protein NKG94_42810 [Micromonospora sp. M12]